MATEKQLVHIGKIQRALGIIEGIATGLEYNSGKLLLDTAVEIIEEAVEQITKDDN